MAKPKAKKGPFKLRHPTIEVGKKHRESIVSVLNAGHKEGAKAMYEHPFGATQGTFNGPFAEFVTQARGDLANYNTLPHLEKINLNPEETHFILMGNVKDVCVKNRFLGLIREGVDPSQIHFGMGHLTGPKKSKIGAASGVTKELKKSLKKYSTNHRGAESLIKKLRAEGKNVVLYVVHT